MTTVPVKCASCPATFHISPKLAFYILELTCAACQKKKNPSLEWPTDLIQKHALIKPNNNKQEN